MLLMVLGATLTASPSAAAEGATCGIAKLEDVEVVTELVPQATITTARVRPKKPGDHEWFGYTTPSERLSKRYRVTVRLNNVLYTGESSGDGFWNFNPTTLVINDSIHGCVTKDKLRITRPDGKDYTTKIVRTIREIQP
jgi:hypothetical protein